MQINKSAQTKKNHHVAYEQLFFSFNEIRAWNSHNRYLFTFFFTNLICK